MFSKSSMLSFLTIALGATSVLGASIPVRRVEPEISSLSRRDSSGGYISMAYFVNWGIYARNFQPSDIDTKTLTHILYAFMDVDPASGHIKLSDSFADTDKHYDGDSWSDSGNNVYGCIKQMYALKLANRNLKVSFSVGGWTYAQAGHFNFASDATMRATFVSDAITYIENFGFDGIDIDWEYPNTDDESSQFSSLMSELRAALDALATKKGDSTPYLLTAAVSAGPDYYKYYKFTDVDKSLSFWNLMSYDYAGSWSNFSADNANVYYGETTGFNTDQAVQAYIKGGATAGKIMMGMPLYGRSFEETAGIYQTFTGIGTADTSSGSYEAGVYDFKHLPLAGSTVTENKTNIASYSYDSTKKELITFDTANIIKMKAQYLMKQGLAGAMFWELSGDKTGSDSLVGASAGVLGSLDTTQNHINYPNSIYDNIKNNLGGSSGSSSGSTGSSSTASSSSSTASSSTESSSTEVTTTPVVTGSSSSTTMSSSTTTSSSTVSTATGNTCAAKRRV